MSEAHAAGVPETSHYPALRTLLNEIGGKLKPKVRCVINPKSKGEKLAMPSKPLHEILGETMAEACPMIFQAMQR